MSAYWTIGGLLGGLRELNADAEVFIDNCRPTALSSYRGDYSHLAIERRSGVEHDETVLDQPGDPFDINLPGWGTYTPGSQEVRIKHPATVGELVKALGLAIGATFEGYKGGQYRMDASTDIWVSEYGRWESLRVIGVEVLPGRVDLVTREEEW